MEWLLYYRRRYADIFIFAPNYYFSITGAAGAYEIISIARVITREKICMESQRACNARLARPVTQGQKISAGYLITVDTLWSGLTGR